MSSEYDERVLRVQRLRVGIAAADADRARVASPDRAVDRVAPTVQARRVLHACHMHPVGERRRIGRVHERGAVALKTVYAVVDGSGQCPPDHLIGFGIRRHAQERAHLRKRRPRCHRLHLPDYLARRAPPLPPEALASSASGSTSTSTSAIVGKLVTADRSSGTYAAPPRLPYATYPPYATVTPRIDGSTTLKRPITSSYTSYRSSGPTMHVFAGKSGTTTRGRPSMSPRKSASVLVPGAPISDVRSCGSTTRVVSTSEPSAAHTSSEHQIAPGMRCPAEYECMPAV